MRKTILIFLFALLGVLSAQAYDFEVDGIYYNIISDTSVEVTTNKYGHSGSLVIPSTVKYNGNSYHVTAIGERAFFTNKSLTSVTIPESVTTIGEQAFYGCSGLISVTIGESVTSIGLSAFASCRGLTSVKWNARYYNEYRWGPFSSSPLTSIIFGNKVEHIPAHLCKGMNKLKSVTIPESVTSIGDYAFYSCSGLTSVTIPEGVTTIGDYAFYSCSGLTSVTIGESVTSIGDYAFSQCSGLTSVTIPEGVTTIGMQAFYGCTSISNPLCNNRIFAYMPQNYSGEYEIPSSIRSIAGGAFYKCSGLTSVTIPEGINSISSYAFYDCSGLTSVTIPERVTSIMERAFYGCSGLTSVTIPERVTYLEAFAFSDCGLTSVTCLARRPPVAGSSYEPGYGGYAFNVSIDTLYVPKGCKEAYEKAYVDHNWDFRYFVWTRFNNIEELSAGTATITVNVNDTSMGRVTGGGEFEIDEEITIEAIPNPGYRFVKWDDWNTDNPRTLTVTADITLTAVFAINTYTVTVNVNDTAMGRVRGGGEYEIDEEITIEAIPNPGYHFVKWDDGNTDNSRILTVTEDITLTAIFAKGDPTPNENHEANNFRVYTQDRTIHLSESRGAVQVYNMAGQCLYKGTSTTIPVPQSGVYIVAVGSQRFKVLVR